MDLQDNVALIVVLDATAGQGQEKPADAPRRQLICVANTHIHANPELNDVKLWQVCASLSTVSAAQDISLVRPTSRALRWPCLPEAVLVPHGL